MIFRRLATMGMALAVAATLVSSSCKDTTPVCVPASKTACYCHTGGPGEELCADDGLSWGACSCLPDAGTDAAGPADAAPDAGAAVSPDLGTPD
jgi:hypothetical protein